MQNPLSFLICKQQVTSPHRMALLTGSGRCWLMHLMNWKDCVVLVSLVKINFSNCKISCVLLCLVFSIIVQQLFQELQQHKSGRQCNLHWFLHRACDKYSLFVARPYRITSFSHLFTYLIKRVVYECQFESSFV